MSSLAKFFDEQHYLRVNADVAAAIGQPGAVTSGFDHFIKFGMKEGRSPNVFFDASYYLEENADVAAAVDSGATTAYEHFVDYGHKEQRSPTALFDPNWYMLNNNDVAVRVYRGEATAYGHFLNNGSYEVRQSTPYFSPQNYMTANTDVAQAYSSGAMAPLRHFAEYGIAESRTLGNGISLSWFGQDPAFASAIFSGNFSGAFERVADVAPFIPSFEKPAAYIYPSDLTAPEDFQSSAISLALPAGVEISDPPESFSQLTFTYGANSLAIGGTGAEAGVTVDLDAGTVTDGAKTLVLRDDAATTTLDASGIATAPVTVSGGSGDETITGTAQADTLNGGDGDDQLNGGAGADTLTGGDGADTFVFSATAETDADTVLDFTTGTDTVRLSDAAYGLTGAAGDTLAGGDYAEVANAAALAGGSLDAATNAQKIIVLQDGGTVYYNADGAEAGGLVLIGTLQTGGGAADPALSDFILG